MKTLYGDLIKQAREDAGLTVAQLADRCRFRERCLEAAEEGEPILSNADLVAIANALDISSIRLMEGELRRNADMPDLDELFRRAEQKAAELKETILEMKAAAAAITGRTVEPELKAERQKEMEVQAPRL